MWTITISLGNFFDPIFVLNTQNEIRCAMEEKKKYQVTISFELDDDSMHLVQEHRSYISSLINKEVIDHYAVSLESRRIWITFNAESKEAVDEYLAGSPLFKYWIYEIDELYVLDGLTYRLPHVQLN